MSQILDCFQRVFRLKTVNTKAQQIFSLGTIAILILWFLIATGQILFGSVVSCKTYSNDVNEEFLNNKCWTNQKR